MLEIGVFYCCGLGLEMEAEDMRARRPAGLSPPSGPRPSFSQQLTLLGGKSRQCMALCGLWRGA
jgi:hypothetical protein